MHVLACMLVQHHGTHQPSQFSARWSPPEPTCGRAVGQRGEVERAWAAGREAGRRASRQHRASLQATGTQPQGGEGASTDKSVCKLRNGKGLTLPRCETSVRDHSARARSKEVVSRLTSLAEGPCMEWQVDSTYAVVSSRHQGHRSRRVPPDAVVARTAHWAAPTRDSPAPLGTGWPWRLTSLRRRRWSRTKPISSSTRARWLAVNLQGQVVLDQYLSRSAHKAPQAC